VAFDRLAGLGENDAIAAQLVWHYSTNLVSWLVKSGMVTSTTRPLL
jgi:hypothetical protein